MSIFTTLDGGDGGYEIHTATFVSGAVYTVQDDTNVAGTRRTFAATASAPSGGGSSSGTSGSSSGKVPTSPSVDPVVSAIGPLVGSLAASVSTAGKLGLTFKGKSVSSLRSGRYKLVVLAETSKAAFNLQRVGKAAKTLSTAGFVGRHTVTITLQRGQWVFFSSPAKKRFFIATA